MKIIKLPIRNSMTISVKGKDIRNKPLVDLPNGSKGFHIGSLGGEEYKESLDIARENGAEIIWATINIERKLENVITKYLFTVATGNFPKRNFFIHEIMNTSLLSFSDKKELVYKIINSTSYIKGKEKSKFQRNLKQIITYRNAFAHGEIDIFNGDIFLNYYTNANKKDELNDLYWEQVEQVYKAINIMLDKLIQEISMSWLKPDKKKIENEYVRTFDE